MEDQVSHSEIIIGITAAEHGASPITVHRLFSGACPPRPIRIEHHLGMLIGGRCSWE
jgi:hypothetical protein